MHVAEVTGLCDVVVAIQYRGVRCRGCCNGAADAEAAASEPQAETRTKRGIVLVWNVAVCACPCMPVSPAGNHSWNILSSHPWFAGGALERPAAQRNQSVALHRGESFVGLI